MAEDKKFKFENGNYINRVSGEIIPDNEPIIIFRARDIHALNVLVYYRELCNTPHHLQAINDRIEEFNSFRKNFPNMMKEPGITEHIKLNREDD